MVDPAASSRASNTRRAPPHTPRSGAVTPPARRIPELVRSLVAGRIARGTVGGFLLRVGSTTLGFATSLLLARSLGAAGYGAYAYAFAWVNLLVIPSAFGLDVLLVRETAADPGPAKQGANRALRQWSHRLVTTLSIAIMAGLAAAIWGLQRAQPGMVLAVVIAAASLPARALTNLKQGTLRGLRHVIMGQFPEAVLRPLLVIVLLLAASLVYGDRFDSTQAVSIAVFAAWVSFGVATLLEHRALPQALKVAPPTFHRREWLASALPFLFVSGMFVVNNRADIVMLGAIRGESAVGYYSVAAKAATLITFILAGANAALAPSFSRSFAAGQLERMLVTLRRATALVLLTSLPIVLVLMIWGRPLLSLFGSGFASAYPPLLVLSIGQLMNVATGPVGQLLNMTGHERDTAVAVGSSAVLNIVLNAALIPLWGLMGAAAATACSTVFWNVLLARYVYLRFGSYAVFGVIRLNRTT